VFDQFDRDNGVEILARTVPKKFNHVVANNFIVGASLLTKTSIPLEGINTRNSYGFLLGVVGLQEMTPMAISTAKVKDLTPPNQRQDVWI
jgi:hypothetical protein